VRSIVDGCYNEAKRILTENLDQLHALAKGLLEYETLTGEEIHRVLRGEPVNRDETGGGPAPSRPGAPTGGRTSVPTGGGLKGGPFNPEPQPGA
jgi:cell division protease FtsH